MIQIIALLHATKNGIEGLRTFESKVIPILREHKGKLISASYNDNKTEDEPDEVHVIQFPSIENFEAYKSDARVVELASLKSEMISKMDVLITNMFYEY